MSILRTIHQHQSVSQFSRVTNSNKFTTRVAVFISPCHLELDVLTNERRGWGDGDQSEVRSPSETMTRNNRVQRHTEYYQIWPRSHFDHISAVTGRAELWSQAVCNDTSIISDPPFLIQMFRYYGPQPPTDTEAQTVTL